jgi:pilus assembly protein Flp/PilA
MTFVKKFIRSEEAISAVEYALLLAFIGAGIAAAAAALGTAVQGKITSATSQVNGTTGS